MGSIPDKAYAGTYDNAKQFYDKYGNDIVFKDGYFYYATKGKQASASVNTTHWGTIGYRMQVKTKTQSPYIYFELAGSSVENTNEKLIDGYLYNLYRINLTSVKSKLAQKNKTAYGEFVENGGTLIVDSCMITIKIDKNGNRTNSGSMDDSGKFTGKVYTDYDGIANAAPWSDPSSLKSFFNKKITYATQLLSKQIVYVRYQDATGAYGEYKAVINRNFVYGETVSWSRSEDATYKEASISYTAKQEKTSYVSVTRKKYEQKVYVKYQDAKGTYPSDWTLVKNQSVYYGASFEWVFAETECYNGKTIAKYTVKEAKDHYITITRKQYQVTLSKGTGIQSVSGDGKYYYGASCTVDAVVKAGYTWSKWTGSKTSTTKKYTVSVTGTMNIIANAIANSYSVEFHPNGGSGTMTSLSCQYDETYTLPGMKFTAPSDQCRFIGWNTNRESYEVMYTDKQQIKNLSTANGATILLYAIWDYEPELACENRYFTLYEAKSGIITKQELLRTASGTDREDGSLNVEIKNYSASMFTSLTAASEVMITYQVKDRRNNVVEKQVKVTVVDTAGTEEGLTGDHTDKIYGRFISKEYYGKDAGYGGLEETSRWRLDRSYRNLLSQVMNTEKREDGSWTQVRQTWVFEHEDIVQVKEFVTEKGLGNSKREGALGEFLRRFGGCREQ